MCRLAEMLTESKGRDTLTLRSVERQVSLFFMACVLLIYNVGSQVEFRQAETAQIGFQLLLGQVGEVVAVRGCAAEKEGAGDDIVNLTGFRAQGAVQGKAEELALFVADEGDRLLKGIDCLDIPSDNLLHRFQPGFDLRSDGFFQGPDDDDFHKMPP